MPDINRPPLSSSEVEQTIRLLSRLEQGHLPYGVFMQLARLATLGTVELVPLRDKDDSVDVLLIQRPKGDPWEGQWHVPGTVILPTDELKHPHDYEAPLGRLIGSKGELKSGVKILEEPKELWTERRKTRRGDELSVVHRVLVEGEPSEGQFFSAEDFPYNVPESGVIDHHVGFVERAVKSYLAEQKRGT